ncbi:unnamed protein product [Linum tenue]|uniref:Uncharacterized protein n=1 Tax=Linum tenue TaxID=586396 RepID=A0AAV0KQQ5_9ROSI|nr:unnamed protein product [Linum tenue]
MPFLRKCWRQLTKQLQTGLTSSPCPSASRVYLMIKIRSQSAPFLLPRRAFSWLPPPATNQKRPISSTDRRGSQQSEPGPWIEVLQPV